DLHLLGAGGVVARQRLDVLLAYGDAIETAEDALEEDLDREREAVERRDEAVLLEAVEAVEVGATCAGVEGIAGAVAAESHGRRAGCVEGQAGVYAGATAGSHRGARFAEPSW